jgi:hypothetical protein
MPHRLVVHCTQPHDIYCGRGPKDFYGLGNKWSHLTNTLAYFRVATREESILKHKEYFLNRYAKDNTFKELIDSLKDKRLACWCAPLSCHCDIIAIVANGEYDFGNITS